MSWLIGDRTTDELEHLMTLQILCTDLDRVVIRGIFRICAMLHEMVERYLDAHLFSKWFHVVCANLVKLIVA